MDIFSLSAVTTLILPLLFFLVLWWSYLLFKSIFLIRRESKTLKIIQDVTLLKNIEPVIENAVIVEGETNEDETSDLTEEIIVNCEPCNSFNKVVPHQSNQQAYCKKCNNLLDDTCTVIEEDVIKKNFSKNPEEVFNTFLKNKNLWGGYLNKSIVVDHLKIIFDGGKNDARLDVGELNKHTEGKLFHYNTLIKAILGVFIVVGLLGTLSGLSQTLYSLGEINLGSGDNLSISNNIHSLLSGLKESFKPSVIGVFFTVCGVLVYGIYLHVVCVPLKSKLEFTTIHNWVPNLFPNSSQRIKETLDLTEKKAIEIIEASEEIAKFVDGLDTELKEFKPNIEGANRSLESITISFRSIEKVAGTLSKSLSGIDRVHLTLEEMYSEVVTNSREANKVFKNLDLSNEGMKNELSKLSQLDVTVHRGLDEVRKGIINLKPPLEDSVKKIEGMTQTFITESSSSMSGIIGQFQKHSDANQKNIEGINATFRSLNSTLTDLCEEIKRLTKRVDKSEKKGKSWFRRIISRDEKKEKVETETMIQKDRF
jgi:predicted  nucleic acid-binding Zn-ribbon protein